MPKEIHIENIESIYDVLDEIELEKKWFVKYILCGQTVYNAIPEGIGMDDLVVLDRTVPDKQAKIVTDKQNIVVNVRGL